jgi:hypothetical protein
MHRRRNRHSEEQRRAVFSFLIKLVLGLSVFGLTAYYSYEAGIRVAEHDNEKLKNQLVEATDGVKRLEAQAEIDQAGLNDARKQAEETKALYDQVKPTDDLRDLIGVLRGKLADGVDAHRLALVVKSVENPQVCDPSYSKRFLVRTPRYRGPESSTSVHLSDLVTLSVEGAGGNGGREQWFDPDNAVKLRISPVGGKGTEVNGRLPIERALVVKGSEIHFTVTAASGRGFVEVASTRCDFP